MEKEFVPYEESLELKELGFNEPCVAYYHDRVEASFVRDLHRGDSTKNSEQILYSTDCAAPTFSQAFRFFREKGYDVNVQKESEGVYFGFYWSGVAWVIVGEGTYEQAELECLRKLIEISKNK